MMRDTISRRETLQRLSTASLLALIPKAAIPALAQGETEVRFLDYPANYSTTRANPPARFLDIRKIEGAITPADQFFAIWHFNQPEIDQASYRLKVTGMVDKPVELSLADLRGMRPLDLVAGYECSGNSSRAQQGLCSNGRWTGVRLSDVLKKAGVGAKAREVIFFGADKGPQEVVWRQQTFEIQQQFGRSISVENAMKPEPLLAWALNGEPLRREHGFPLRLIMPGWYGVANVKWLAEIHLQEERYLGNYQARWYRTMRGEGGTGELNDPQTQFVESEITRMRPKSVIARVTKMGYAHRILGFVLNDGSPVRSVEVKIDEGPWQKATLEPAASAYSWKLFNYRWEGATAGEHTLVSRVTEAAGTVQPSEAELVRKNTFLEHNAQHPRKVMIA